MDEERQKQLLESISKDQLISVIGRLIDFYGLRDTAREDTAGTLIYCKAWQFFGDENQDGAALVALASEIDKNLGDKNV
jgi:hypothetical protein